MKKVVAMTIYDRTPETISAVVSSLSFPGNKPDTVAVCYDRAPFESREAMRRECDRIGVELVESALNDDFRGPRCPSLAWNTVMATVESSHALCISSDMVLTPHSVGMAYHMAQVDPEIIIIGRAEHSGTSYFWRHVEGGSGAEVAVNRTMCSSFYPNPLGFVWLLPMSVYNSIGGYDEAFMGGLCYEDTDFVTRLWERGGDFLFCDDVTGFHIEHKRDHLQDGDGRVSINCKLFNDRHGLDVGEAGNLMTKKYPIHMASIPVAMRLWTKNPNNDKIADLETAQRMYGYGESWQAIKPEIVNS